MEIAAVQFTTTEIPKGSPLWQGVQGDRVPLRKLPVITLKIDFREIVSRGLDFLCLLLYHNIIKKSVAIATKERFYVTRG